MTDKHPESFRKLSNIFKAITETLNLNIVIIMKSTENAEQMKYSLQMLCHKSHSTVIMKIQ